MVIIQSKKSVFRTEIAQGIINLPADEAVKRLYVMQDQLYKLLEENPDLYKSNFNLQQFMYANKWQNLDFIHYLGKFMAEGNYGFVNFLLNNWTGQKNDIDENYKKYYETVLQLVYNPDWRPDMEWLYSMANKCPLKEGIIIYAYRNLFNSLTGELNRFENNCEGELSGRGTKQGFVRLKQPPVVKTSQSVKASVLLAPKSQLYPNPAHQFVTINYKHIKQITLYGTTETKTLDRHYMDASNVVLPLSGLSKGCYQLKIITMDNKTSTEKLIVQ